MILMKQKEPNKALTRLYAMIQELLRHPHFDREEFYKWIDTVAKVEFQSIYFSSVAFEKLTKENLSIAKELNGRYKFINTELVKEIVL